MQENKRMGTRLAPPVYSPDAAQMALFTGERRRKPLFYRVFRLFQRQEPQSEGEGIGIVVFAGRRKNVELLAGDVHLLHSRVSIVERAAHACEAVGDHRLALPGGTGDDGAAVFAREYVGRELLRGGRNDGGVVVFFVERVRSAILDLIAKRADVFDERVFGFKSGVVARKIYLHSC